MTGKTLLRIAALLLMLVLLTLLVPSSVPLALSERMPASQCMTSGGSGYE